MIKKFKAASLILLLSLQFITVPSRAAGLSCLTLPELIKAYLISHVTTHNLSNEVKDKAIEQYVKSLDSFKMLLLEDDVKKIKNDLKGIFETMKTGNCAVLDQIQGIAVQRAAEMEEVVKSVLGPATASPEIRDLNKIHAPKGGKDSTISNPAVVAANSAPEFKLDETVEFQMDPEKRRFPKNIAERDEFLKKYLHFQVSNYLLADTKLAEAKNLLVHRYELITKRMKERSGDKLLAEFTKAFSASLDPHTSYFTRDDREDFEIDMRLSLEGIGASLSSQDGYTVVEEIIAGGAADRAKVLIPKDKIIAVSQEKGKAVPVIDMDLRDVVKLIRGKKGSKVKLTILRQTEKTEHLEVTIVRDKVDLKDAEAKISFENRKLNGKNLKLGIIELPSFYGDGEKGKRSSFTDMERLLKKARSEKIDGLLLNLSRNGGGLLEDAVRISGLFIKKGGVVATQNSRKNVEILADEDESIGYAGPLVILTSRLSASASEILAGALRDYNRAIVVGADHTFGKGTVQAVIPLPGDLGAMKVTTGLFFIPGGNSTQHQGVAAHVVIPSPLNNDEIGEKALDNSLPPQKIERFVGSEANFTAEPSRWAPLSDSLVQTLLSASKDRVSKDAKFAEILKDLAEAKKNQGIIRLADVRKKGEAEKKKNKGSEKKSTAQRIKDADAPVVKESLNILTDLITFQANNSQTTPDAKN